MNLQALSFSSLLLAGDLLNTNISVQFVAVEALFVMAAVCVTFG